MRRLLYLLFTCCFIIAGTGTALAAPVANFSATPTTSCAPLIVQFTDLSTGSPTSWSWNLGNGTSSTLQNPSTTYTAAGTYNISLTVSNASGTDTKTINGYITVTGAPSVSFVATDSTAACGSKTMTLVNSTATNSTGTATYYWDFGDGYTSTAVTPPAHIYTIPGSYNVSLVVTNGAGCTKSLVKTNYITVYSRPTANFSASNTNNCAPPVTTAFTNTSSGASSYQWDFGDGGTSTASSPSHSYTTSGSYTVRMIATTANGCQDTITKSALVNIGSLTAAFTAPSSTCTRNPVTFTNTTMPGGGGSTWYFGDGTTSTAINPTHSYASSGTYTVKLVVNYTNCSDSVTHTITVNSGPSTSFAGSPLSGCTAPLSVTFSNSTSGATSYLWMFGDGSTSTATAPTHSYTSLGNYTVQLVSTSSNGCTDTATQTSYVNIQAPTATLSNYPYIGCAPASVTFTPTINSLVSVSSYSWNFGDGSSTGTGGPNKAHTYSTAGTYTVMLTVTTTTGCTFTASQNVIVGSHTVPYFTATPTTVCYKHPIMFMDTATTGVTNYLWDFGDGGNSVLPSPMYVYGAPGIYTVKLYTSNNGCFDTLIKTNYVTVNGPKADFAAHYICTNRKQFTFTNTSIQATSFDWSFGDGGTDTAKNPVHTYSAYGTYYVRLIAYNSTTGCVDTMLQPVTAYVIDASFSATDTVICKGATAAFHAANNAAYFWDYGDGYRGPTGGNATFYPYGNTGLYTIKFIATDYEGCKDSTTRINYLHVHSPHASFGVNPSAGCQQLMVTFTDSSSAYTGYSISNRLWIFGDGNTLNTGSTTVTHNYVSAGTYTVKLVITESGGCTDTVSKLNLITVNHPNAGFYSVDTQSCKNGLTVFTNTSTSNSSLIYAWSFGDGSTSTLTAPTHSYTNVGNYTVRLIATDAGGCTDTLTQPNYIHVTTVQAGFAMSDSTAPCPPKVISFTNTSSGAATYLWKFGNGGSSNIANPSAIYTSAGIFTAKLIATNTAGCKDSFARTVTINTGPAGSFTYTPITGCAPVSITFSATSSSATSLTYDFGNGITNTTTSNSIFYSYTYPGSFTPTLILSDTNGCSTYINGTSAINVVKATAGFYANPTSGCVGTSVQFTDTSTTVGSSIVSRSYNFGDGGSSTATNPTHTYTTAGTYSVSEIVTTSSGCQDTARRTVVINALPAVNAGADVGICTNASAMLSATGASTYSWSPATTLSSSTGATVTASPTVTTSYVVTGTSAVGCVASDTVVVTVTPLPSLSVSAPAAICNGSSTTLIASGATSYSWSPSTGLSSATGASVSASPTATTAYTVTGTTNGCSATASVTVTVNPIPVVAIAGSGTICAGMSDTLIASGANTYSWSPSTGLSATTGATVIASPSTTKVYTVTGTSNGCSATATATVTITPIPVVSISGNNAICAGLSTNLTASGATTYSWSPATGLSATTGATVTASPTATTTYTVTGTTSGCSGTATKALTVNPRPTVSSGGNKSICAGASATLTASGASTYSWSPSTGLSGVTGTPVTASPTTTTTYTVTGTDANGCINTDTARITVNPLPIVSAGPAQFMCPGGTVTLRATGAATYVWSPSTGLSATTGDSVLASPSATKIYKVVGTSLAGCIDSNTVTVNVNSTPTVTVSGTKTICFNSSTSLTASGANTYAWSPSTGLSATTGATVTANPTTTTTYTVTGTSGIGCTGSTPVTITVNALPVVGISAPAPICAGASATLTASGASTYVWSPATGLSATTGTSVTASAATTTSYTVTGTDANGCQNTAKDTLIVNARPVINAGSPVSICPGDSTILTASGANTYTWSPAANLSATTGVSVTAKPTLSTVYKAVGTNAAGCKDSATVAVTVNGKPVLSVSGTRVICRNSSTTLTASGANTYSWSPSAGLSATTGASVTANPATTTTYRVTGTNGVGCFDTISVTVTVNQLPNVNAGIDTAVCAGGSVALAASGASTYTWSPSAGLSATTGASVTATPTTPTNYIVTGTDANGCVKSDTVFVNVKALPTVSGGSNTTICPGNSATLTATGGISFAWTPTGSLSSGTGATVTATPSLTTIYTVTGTGANGCINTATVQVAVNATPTVAISGTNTICAGGSTTLTASGAGTYSWSPSTGLSATTGTTVTANPAATTLYTVTGTSGVGCTGTATFTVTVNALPTVNAGIDTAVCAGGSVVLAATGASSYVWSPAATLSSTTTATVTATPTISTNYVVTGTGANGCTKTDTVLVTVKALPAISAGSGTSICPGNSATLTATGGVSYAWTPTSTLSSGTGASVTATPSTTTIYTVTGTGANGCVSTATVQVAVNATPSVTVSGNNAICANGSTTLTASGANSFSWSPATGLSATTGASVTANPASTTTYTITGTSGVGCTGTATFTLTVNPLPGITVSGTKTICTGSSTTLTASGANTYVWSPSTGLSATTGAVVTANPTTSTVYTVTGTSTAGCVSTANVSITVNAKPTVTVSPTSTAVCPGNSATLTAGGASTYSWTPSSTLSAATGATVSATPSGTTTYTVTGTDANGCQNTASTIVSVNATPNVSVSGTTSICANASTTLTASGANSYSWSPATGLSATTGATVTAAPTSTTTYTITGTSGVGCTGTTTVTVTVNALPGVNAGPDTAVCAGGSITLTATGASSYVWSPAAALSSTTGASVTATPSATTPIICTGTNAAGCTGTDTVLVTVKALPNISASGTLGVCPGGSTVLTATGGVSYAWTPSSTLSSASGATVTATPATGTTYIITGTGSNGCTNTANISVAVNPKPVLSISGNTSICAGTQTTLTASGASSYAWSPSAGISATTGSNVTVSVATTTTYKVIGTSGLGCQDSANVTVTVHQRPVITVNADTTLCRNVPVQLTAGGASVYQWAPVTGLSCTTCSNPVAMPAASTSYVVRGTDNYGCTDSAHIRVTILPIPTIVASGDVSICKATSTQLTATGGLSYVWTPVAGLSCTACANPLASPSATTAYVVTGTGANGCTANDTVTVSLYPQPPVNAGPDQTICAGQSAQLQASGGIGYVWTPAASLSCGTCANPLATPAASTTYTVVGTDIHGCNDSDAVTISVIQHVPIAAGDSAAICEGESVKLYASGGDSYLWSPAATLSCSGCATPTATPKESTTYSVVIKQGQCFSDTLNVPITVHPLPKVNAGPDQSIVLGSTAQLNATGTNIATYSWSPGDYLSCLTCPDPVVAPERDVTYTVIVRSPFGCEAQDNIAIHVRCEGTQIWLPNTFTPNADGHNDFFYPHGKGISEITKMRIYDRWGELIWERSNLPVNDRNSGWDGTYKNELLKPDVYVWIISAKCTNGESLELKGDISLIR